MTFKAKAEDLSFKAKAKDLTFKAKYLKIVVKDSLRPRPRTPVTGLGKFVRLSTLPSEKKRQSATKVGRDQIHLV